MSVAKENKFHPVAVYLRSLRKWDRHDWIDDVATNVLQLPSDDKLSRLLLRKTLIGAVARALDPGCKLDTVCILVGKQGSWKSTFWSTLAGGPEFFTDTAVNLKDKDSYMLMQCVWFYEWSELETKRRAADESAVKSFLSSRYDKFRPPYARAVEEMPRSCIIVGTSNPARILNDPTGARRYWPIPLGATQSATQSICSGCARTEMRSGRKRSRSTTHTNRGGWTLATTTTSCSMLGTLTIASLTSWRKAYSMPPAIQRSGCRWRRMPKSS